MALAARIASSTSPASNKGDSFGGHEALVGVMGPHAGEKVGLEFESDGELIVLAL